MKMSTYLGVALGVLTTATALGQTAATREGPGVQAAADAREPAVLARCKNLAPARTARFAPPAPISPKYHVQRMPGVIAAGQRWKVIWHTPGNNADGIIATPDGGIFIAQNDKSDVLQLTAKGHASVAYQDTDTGGALSMNKLGQLFIVERGLNASIWELAPQHKAIANRYSNGDSFDCTRGGLSDLSAAASGFIYFAEAGASQGLFYTTPDGRVTQYPQPLRTNGIILSPDEKTLYVTNAGTLVAFDVQPDGSLANQRNLATIPGGGGDGSTVDAAGRIYVSGYAGVRVFAPDGTVLGIIPAPIYLVSLAFSGPDKKTLFAVGELRTNKPGIAGIGGMQVLTIPMIAQGYQGRAK